MIDSEIQMNHHAQTDKGVVRTISPDEHPITLDRIDSDALFILRKLKKSGFSGYLVGGGVRDIYLGKTPKDFDISTDARPGQLRKLFRNSATIGRRFKLVQLFFKNSKIIEVSTLRSLSEHDLDGPETVLAPNNTFGTLDQDALRRDLTINSLFYEIENRTIIDFVGGVDDLDHSIIRIVGDPDVRLTRDPVRMLRAIRHAARNNFTIEQKSWKSICKHYRKLSLCPPSRLRDEFLKDLYSGSAGSWFKLADDSGIFLTLFPIYTNHLYQTDRNGNGVKEQLEQILAVVDRLNSLQKKSGVSQPADYFLLALLLIPWAVSKYDITNIEIKGPALFQLSKQIRNSIDKDFGIQLNLRKSLRQEIASLLTNLTQFIYHYKKEKLPHWLKKKSYFEKANLFYHCYLEAETGTQVPDKLLHLETVYSKDTLPPKRRKRSSRSKQRPVLASRGKGSIFGLKR